MMKTPVLAVALSLLCLTAGSATADDELYTKDTWPLALTDRPILIPQGMLEIRGDSMRLNLSDGAAGDPIQIAPDAFYGVSSKLNIGIVHADDGICVSGDSCAKSYNDIGVDALYGFMNKGSFLLALRGGVRIPSFDGFVGGLNLGLATQLSAGSLRFDIDPTLYVGVIGRESDEMGEAAMKETLSVPVHVWYQLHGQTALFLRTGLEGPLEGFGDAFQVPIGVGALFAINNRVDIGAEFRFANAAGNDATVDARWLFARAQIRL